MQTSPREFFVAGGTLQPDAPSYIERQADRELFERVLASNFCYVLTTRQMGKSSLMARTAKRLREHGVQTAIIDLTQIGTEKEKQSADRWYYGISHRILRELGLNVKLNEWWSERQNLPALQRLTEFFSDLVLSNTKDHVVIFVDEIDSTINLPFTDDFFAAIRACYNARATEPVYQRLSFVLLGVASPSDLMKDPQRTPFNIGHRIDLTDFTFDEARPLAQGLGADSQRGEQALQRVLYWTNGHPYLTQKLCRAILEENLNECAERDIDHLVDQHFLAPEANRQEYNLNFVRDRLTGDRRASRPLLKAYRRICRRQRVVDNPLSPVHTVLKLSGLVVPREERRLAVRNRIYESVFTPDWVKRVMPVDWNRRIAIASSMLVVLLGFGIWYTQFLPRENIKILLRIVNDPQLIETSYPLVKNAYESLHRIPGFASKADNLLAEYWDHRALNVEMQEDRDKALLFRLKALSIKETKMRRNEASFLADGDYQNLIATYRHSESVVAVAFSRDGQKVVTGSEDKTAQLWSTQNGAALGEPMKHKGNVYAVAFSPDGQRVVTASADNTARLWSAQNGAALGEPMQHNDDVLAVAFSPDGRRVVTGSADNTARLWSAETGEALSVPMRHEMFVNAVAFSPDGQKVVTGSGDINNLIIEGGMARLWSAQTGAALGAPMRHERSVYEWSVNAVAFSPDGQKVVTGSADWTARLWSTQTGAALGEPMQHQGGVMAVAFSPDGQTVVTGSWDFTARLWSAQTGAALNEPMWHERPIYAVAFSPDGQKVVTGSSDGTARLWSVQTGEALGDPMRHSDEVRVVAFSADGRKVVTGSDDGTARLWLVQTTTLNQPIRNQGMVWDAAFSPDGQKVVTGSIDSTARIWSARDGIMLSEPMRHQGPIFTVAISTDPQRLVTGSADSTARLWSAETGEALGAPMPHKGFVFEVAFSPDGQKVVTGSYDGTARLWSARNGMMLNEPMRHQGLVYAVTFSPDNQKVATVSNGSVQLWSAQKGTALGAPMQDKNNTIIKVAFSPDGQKLATVTNYGMTQLWSVQNDTVLSEPMQNHYADEVAAVAFSPDGKSLMAATQWWMHVSAVVNDTSTPIPKSNRLFSGTWTGAYHFIDQAGKQLQVAVRVTGNSLRIDTLRFNTSSAFQLSGEPSALLGEWQRKLALKIEDYEKIPSERPVPITTNLKQYTVMVGRFETRKEAGEMAAELRSRNINNFILEADGQWLVCVGKYVSAQRAAHMVKTLESYGLSNAVVLSPPKK